MALDLLEHIASSPLPTSFRAPDDIDKVRLLRAAGLVIALVPDDAHALATSPEGVAQVIAITQRGREELQQRSERDQPLARSASTTGRVERLRKMVERARQSLR